MAVLLALLALGIILLTGDLLLSLLAPKHGMSAGQMWPLAFVLGSGCVALLVFWLSFLAGKYALMITASLIPLFAAADLYRRAKAGRRAIPVLHLPDKKGLIVVVIAAGFLFVIFSAARTTSLGYDSIALWGIKAKIVFIEGGWSSVASYSGWLKKLNYPLLIPSQQAFIYGFMKRVDEQAVKIMFTAYFMALATFFYATVRLDYGRFLTLVFTALLVTTPLLTISGISGYADMPLMVFPLISAVLIQRWLKSDANTDLLLAGIVMALVIWVKREGSIFWIVAAIYIAVYVFVRADSRQIKTTIQKLVIFAGPALVIAGPWLLYLGLNDFPDTDFNSIGLVEFFANSSRIPTIVNYLIDEFFSIRSMGIVWILFAIVTIWRRRDLTRPGPLFLWIFTIIPLLLLNAAFVFTSWKPFTLHLDNAVDRLVMQVVPLAWLFVANGSRGLNQWLAEMVKKPTATESEEQMP